MKKVLLLALCVSFPLISEEKAVEEQEIVFEKEKRKQKAIYFGSKCRKCPSCYYHIRYRYWEDQEAFWPGKLNDSFYDHFTK